MASRSHTGWLPPKSDENPIQNPQIPVHSPTVQCITYVCYHRINGIEIEALQQIRPDFSYQQPCNNIHCRDSPWGNPSHHHKKKAGTGSFIIYKEAEAPLILAKSMSLKTFCSEGSFVSIRPLILGAVLLTMMIVIVSNASQTSLLPAIVAP